MAKQAYIIEKADELDLPFQEGDTGSITLEVDEQISMTGLNAFFQVRDDDKNEEEDENLVLTKNSLVTGEIDIVGNNVTMNFEKMDTRGYFGEHYTWELSVDGGPDAIDVTVGRGKFILLKENAKKL